LAGLTKQCGTPSSSGPSHCRARDAIWNATPSNAAQCGGSAQRGLCSSGISNADGDFLQGDDCPTLCANTSMASLRVIAALEWGLSVICALRRIRLSAVRSYESPLDRDCNATCHQPWLLGARSERFAAACRASLGETPSETLRRPSDCARGSGRHIDALNFAWSVAGRKRIARQQGWQ